MTGALPAGRWALTVTAATEAPGAALGADLLLRPASGADEPLQHFDSRPQSTGRVLEPFIDVSFNAAELDARPGDLLILRVTAAAGPFTLVEDRLTIP